MLGVHPTYDLIASMHFSRNPSLRAALRERVTEGYAWSPWESRVGGDARCPLRGRGRSLTLQQAMAQLLAVRKDLPLEW